MSEQQQNQNVEIAGMDVQYPSPIKASRAQVWAAMVDKMYHTDKYLPVSHVKITDVIPDEHAYPEMMFNEKKLSENIYFNESKCEIGATAVDEDHIHVNIYYPDTGILEYWQENGKGERIPWHVPKAAVLAAMKKTKEVAEEQLNKHLY